MTICDLLFHLYTIPWQSFLSGLLIWAAIEAAFYAVLCHVIHPYLNHLRKPPASPIHPRECLHRILGTLDTIKETYGLDRFCAGWFKGARLEEIKRENLKVRGDWVCH